MGIILIGLYGIEHSSIHSAMFKSVFPVVIFRCTQKFILCWARRGILASATAGLQSRNVDNDNWLKVQFLRSKLERLCRTLDDKVGSVEGTFLLWSF
jgi:hypothetical protein